MPLDGALPTSCWAVGQVVSDTLAVELPSDLRPGIYTLQVGMYYLPTGERLAAATPAGTADHVVLQTLSAGRAGQ